MAQSSRNGNITHAFNKIGREVDNIRVYIQTPHISSLRPNDVLIKLRLIVEASEALQTIARTSSPQDNQLINRLNNRAVLAEGRVVNLETQLNTIQTNYDVLYQNYQSRKLLYHFQKATCIEREKRISELLQEKFAFRFIFRRYRNLQLQLDMCKNDLLLSDIQLDTKWGKWKRRFKDLEVRFNNLQRLPPQPVNQVWLLLQ